MRYLLSRRNIASVLPYLIIVLSFVLPITILYVAEPESFQLVFAARNPYIIFLTIFILETIIAGKKFKRQLHFSKRVRVLLAFTIMIIPTAYVTATSFFGLKNAVMDLGKLVGVPYQRFGNWFIDVEWPISLEYIVLVSSYTSIILLAYSIDGLRKLAISLSFLWVTCTFFLLDTFAPYGTIYLLQAFVPFTARSAASILRFLGYETIVGQISGDLGPGVSLIVVGQTQSFSAAVYWPSAGIQSLFIYFIVMLLFIKNLSFTPKWKIFSFTVGALGTLIANVFRIVSICILGVQSGRDVAVLFHDYYGELFFIAWMLIFVTLISFGPKIMKKLTARQKGDCL
jgi:thaumarchaeosortase